MVGEVKPGTKAPNTDPEKRTGIGNGLGTPSSFSVYAVRAQFPVLHRSMHGKPLIYLDNAASTQKPQVVIDTLVRFYSTTYSNVHRGAYALSEEATARYEEARQIVARFVGARTWREIVFVRGATEGINLLAFSLGEYFLREGDTVLVTEMEHHSNLVPWQMVCARKGAHLRVVPLREDGDLDMEALEALLAQKPKVLAVTHVSNSLGTVNPIRRIVEMAHAYDVVVVVDGAQAVAHVPVNVQELDCDFYVFSGHKIYGPTGIGVVYGKEEWLDRLPPYQGGGEMIREVTFEKTTYNEIPYRFEAGTPNIVDAVGLGAALQFVELTGRDQIFRHEDQLIKALEKGLRVMQGVRVLGTPRERVAAISFVVEGVHAHDVGTGLDLHGICVRTGHHCTQPVMRFYGVPATVRPSLAMYNTHEEIERFLAALEEVIAFFRRGHA